jgi:hypothetical protein
MASTMDRSTALALSGAAVALVAGLSIAGFLVLSHRGEKAAAPPASQAGLVIDSAGQAVMRTDPAKPLRCFVGGQLVGEMTVAECAKRNGVATDALDVGLDQTGALAAAPGAGPNLTPLPPQAAKAAPDVSGEIAPIAATGSALQGGPAGACWRFADNQWRKLPADAPLGACVQTLFAGRCERAGEAAYGRWGQQTLRLVAPGRVEISADNHTFRPLTDQSQGCPPV